MPNAGMLDHAAHQTAHPLAAPAWMPAWPSRALGYRAATARTRRHTVNTAAVPTTQGQGSFSRHLTTSRPDRQKAGEDQDAGQRRLRPYSAPAALPLRQTMPPPVTPFTTRLLSIDDGDEEKTNPSSNLWTSASGQRHLKGHNDLTPFHTMQKVTCGAYFARQADHRLTNFGIPPVNTPRWRAEAKGHAHVHSVS